MKEVTKCDCKMPPQPFVQFVPCLILDVQTMELNKNGYTRPEGEQR